MADQFAVLGDLGNGKYIVRMYVAGHVVDEEFEITQTQSYTPVGMKALELRKLIEKRMDGMTDKEAKSIGIQQDEFKSDGHALPMTPEQGLGRID